MVKVIAKGMALSLLLSVLASPVLAKLPTVKLAVSGPGIAQPVELTQADAISANVWIGNFIDKRAAIAEAPPSDLPRYTVQFYISPSDKEVSMMYVVYYVWDAARGRALVQVPSSSDQWYWLNVSTISRCCQGKWFFATPSWADAIRADAIRAALPARQ